MRIKIFFHHDTHKHARTRSHASARAHIHIGRSLRIRTAPEISCDIKTSDPCRDQDACRGNLCSGGRFEDGASVALTHRHDMSSKFSLFGNMKLSEGHHHRYSECIWVEARASWNNKAFCFFSFKHKYFLSAIKYNDSETLVWPQVTYFWSYEIKGPRPTITLYLVHITWTMCHLPYSFVLKQGLSITFSKQYRIQNIYIF